MLIILAQPKDAAEAAQVADRLDEVGCEFVVLDKGAVTRRSRPADDGTADD